MKALNPWFFFSVYVIRRVKLLKRNEKKSLNSSIHQFHNKYEPIHNYESTERKEKKRQTIHECWLETKSMYVLSLCYNRI